MNQAIRDVDVVILGAGTAGLNAVGQVRRQTNNWLLIDGHEELGTTCARVGCMPSKALIHIAEEFHARMHYGRYGIVGGENLSLDSAAAMERVQNVRDILVDRVLSNSVDKMGDKFINEYAHFVAPDTLQVGDQMIRAKAIIAAVGSRPIVPTAWQAFGDRILTTDEFFEQEGLPQSMAVIGLGVIGLELGQALNRLGVDVTAVDTLETIAGIDDPAIRNQAISLIGKELPMWLGQSAELTDLGKLIRVTAGDQSVEVERVLVAIGRRSNVDRLGLDQVGVSLDESGMPTFNPNTLQVEDFPIYIVGDANNDRAILHEAGNEGRIAGFNALRAEKMAFKRQTPLHITFSDPNICQVGATLSELDADKIVTGDFPMGPHGRALVMGNNKGLVHLYVNKADGRLLGSAMVAPRAEHLAHLLAWCIEENLTVYDMLKKPFYHPAFEEALQSAIRKAISQLEIELDWPAELEPL